MRLDRITIRDICVGTFITQWRNVEKELLYAGKHLLQTIYSIVLS